MRPVSSRALSAWSFPSVLSSRGPRSPRASWEYESEVLIHRENPMTVEAVRTHGRVVAEDREDAARLAKIDAERRLRSQGYLVSARVTGLLCEIPEDEEDALLGGDLLG